MTSNRFNIVTASGTHIATITPKGWEVNGREYALSNIVRSVAQEPLTNRFFALLATIEKAYHRPRYMSDGFLVYASRYCFFMRRFGNGLILVPRFEQFEEPVSLLAHLFAAKGDTIPPRVDDAHERLFAAYTLIYG